MNEINCSVIKDLMPLYVDEVCSSASRNLIEEHISHCGDCRMALAEMEAALPLSPSMLETNRREGDALRSLSSTWKRSKVKAFLKGTAITASICAVLAAGYIGLFQWHIRPVPSDIIEISNVSRLSDGRIAYHVKITDGYDLNRTRFDADSSGNFYVVPLRPVVKKKPITEAGLFNMYYLFDEEQTNVNLMSRGNDQSIQALYFGSKKEPLLVWKQGMELPPASAEVEAMFTSD